MTWLWLALGVAVFQALKDVTSKRALRGFDAYTVAFGLRFFSLPLLALFLFQSGIPAPRSDFWWWLLASAVGNGLVTILYMKALQHDDLGVTLPMLAFTPIFMLVTSPIMLGEFPGPAGIYGIVCIVAGSYLLHLGKSGDGQGLLRPFRALFERPGARYMLLVAFIWSVTSNVDRLGIAASSAPLWGFASHAAIACFLAPTLLPGPWRAAPNPVPTGATHATGWNEATRRAFLFLLLLGCLSAGRQISQMLALELTLTPYVIALKRLSIVIGMLLGIALFHEKTGPMRLIGAGVMVAGAALIALFA